jgi:hypothetical protein
MISANLEKVNDKGEVWKKGEFLHSYNLQISCGEVTAVLHFCQSGGYDNMAEGLRELADVFEGI